MIMMETHLWEILIGVVCVLGSTNAFFISRLIKKIDESAVAVSDFKKDLQHMNEKIGQLSDISGRLVSIEKQIAVLDYRAGIKDQS